MHKIDSFIGRVALGVIAAALVPATALAQAPAPPAPPAAAPPAAPPLPAEPPPAAPPVEVAPPSAPPAEPVPPPEPLPPAPGSIETETPAPLPPPAAEEKKEDVFKITTGAGFRAGLRLQKPEEPKKLGGGGLDELNAELRLSGKVTDIVGWTLNLTVDGRTPYTAAAGPGPVKFQAQALDIVGQLDFTDEFHVWLGRMLTPSDRTNFSGPWFISPWNYPGIYGTGYFGPRGTEEVGREVGATIWGNDKAGKFKYYASVLDLDNTNLGVSPDGDDGPDKISPLFSGRLAYAFVGSEPGFYSSSTYYGSQDIVALGVAGQYQAHSTLVPDSDELGEQNSKELVEINADILAEFTAKGAGTFTFEGAYYHFDGPTTVFPVEDAWFGLVSYLTPEPIGVGKIQLLARFQQAFKPDQSAVDAVVSYVMKDYFAKLALGYTHVSLPGDNSANLVQLGFQIQQ